MLTLIVPVHSSSRNSVRPQRACAQEGKHACTWQLHVFLVPIKNCHTAGCVTRWTYDLRLQYAFNLFSHNSPMTGNGYNEEEMKMVKETGKIWGTSDVAITATCIRVPVMRAHAESINLEFERDISEQEVTFY